MIQQMDLPWQHCLIQLPALDWDEIIIMHIVTLKATSDIILVIAAAKPSVPHGEQMEWEM